MKNYSIIALSFLFFTGNYLYAFQQEDDISAQKVDARDELQEFDERQDQLIKFEQARKKFEKEQEHRVKEQKKRINDATIIQDLEKNIDTIDWAAKGIQYPNIASCFSIKEIYLRMLKNAEQELTDQNLETALSWNSDPKKISIPLRLEFILSEVENIIDCFWNQKNKAFTHVAYGEQKLLQSYLFIDILNFLGFSNITLITVGTDITKNRLYHLNLLLSLTYPTYSISTYNFTTLDDFMNAGILANSFDTIQNSINTRKKTQYGKDTSIIQILNATSKEELVSILYSHDNFYLVKDPQLPASLYHTVQQAIDASLGWWNSICGFFTSPLHVLHTILEEKLNLKAYCMEFKTVELPSRELEFLELVELCSEEENINAMALSEKAIITLRKGNKPYTSALEQKKPHNTITMDLRRPEPNVIESCAGESYADATCKNTLKSKKPESITVIKKCSQSQKGRKGNFRCMRLASKKKIYKPYKKTSRRSNRQTNPNSFNP